MSFAAAGRIGARAPRIRRSLHVTARRDDKIGPPHPISNLRPVIYSDAPPASQRLPHPYSLHEFDEDPARAKTDYDLRWKLARQDLDNFNHNFWLDSNGRFEAARQEVLAALPTDAPPLDKEDALSEFYRQWVNWEIIQLEWRVKWQQFKSKWI
ncbi:hypothetical protein BD626DRAFT_557623 [Schizophyllum amplum]|uniref:Apoptogenic protein 1, mitochondrial n=1 Tax=Schizophyllum amplum TaxID=97359 RepID=A0A550CE91_9AGAR|nr:hypothetical protein BD626DRAFT_557623 [Auriculariopsis ampla]